MTKKKLPERVFVTYEYFADGTPWLAAEELQSDLAEKDKIKIVGEYRLVKTESIELQVTSKVIKK